MMDCFLELIVVFVVVVGTPPLCYDELDCCRLLIAYVTALKACDSDFCEGDLTVLAVLMPPVLCKPWVRSWCAAAACE